MRCLQLRPSDTVWLTTPNFANGEEGWAVGSQKHLEGPLSSKPSLFPWLQIFQVQARMLFPQPQLYIPLGCPAMRVSNPCVLLSAWRPHSLKKGRCTKACTCAHTKWFGSCSSYDLQLHVSTSVAWVSFSGWAAPRLIQAESSLLLPTPQIQDNPHGGFDLFLAICVCSV